MKESGFFDLIDDPEIGDEAYAFLFSLCDRVRYLVGYRTERDVAEELLSSPYQNVLPSLLSAEKGDDWNMEGTYLSFSLSEPVRRMVKENSLGGLVTVGTVRGENVFLENLSLWKGEKRLYAVCSHEGYTDADEDFLTAVGRFCLDQISATQRYAAMKEKFSGLSLLPKEKQRDGYSVLSELCGYVSEAIGDWFYVKPSRACPYGEFLAIAEKFLTADVCEELRRAGSFAGLHPPGAPDMALLQRDIEARGTLLTQEERDAIRSHPRFRESPLAERIRGELRMLQAVSFRETGEVPFVGGGGAPTIVIRQEK